MAENFNLHVVFEQYCRSLANRVADGRSCITCRSFHNIKNGGFNLLKPPHKANRYGKPVCPTEVFLSCSADGQIPFYIVLFSKNTVYLTYSARSAVPSNSPVRRTPKYKEQSLGKPFLANLLLTGYMSTVSESCEHSCSEYSRYKSVPEDR